MVVLKEFVLSLVFFIALDAAWFMLIASSFYKAHLGPLLRLTDGAVQPNWYAAACVYVLLALGITFFVLGKSPVLLYGALFGLIVYGVYDFTNLALFRGWTLSVVLVDVAWGVVVCSLVAWLTTLVSARI